MTCLQRGLIAMKQEKSKLSKKRFLLLFCLFIISFSLICIWGSSSVFAVTVEQAKNAGKRLSAGLNHSLMIKIDDTVVAWGDDTYGQGAEGTANVGLSGVKMISAGYYHNIALKSDGTVVAWGRDNNGQCSGIPTGLIGVSEIAAGGYHSLALKDGEVLAWGNNANGQCTVPLEAQSGVIAIAAGGYHSLALKEDGTVVAWGLNTNGQCSGIPADLTDVIAIAAGDAHSLALKADGTVVAWGANEAWQCEVPDGLKDVVAIAAGGKFSLVLTSGGTVETWGEDIGIPPALTGCGVIATRGSYALAVKSSGASFITWGNNDSGQCTVPSGLTLVGELANISLNPEGLFTDFDPNIHVYEINVDNSVTTVYIAATKQSDNQSLSGGDLGNCAVPVGKKNHRVAVALVNTSIERQYNLYIYRAAANLDLKSLSVNKGLLIPYFIPGITSFTVNVDQDVESINITATPNDAGAAVTIGENDSVIGVTQTVPISITYGDTPLNITVEKDGQEPQSYSLTIKKGGFLEKISLSAGEFTTAFDPERFGYTVSVNSNVTSLGITPTLRDPNHELLINGIVHTSGTEKFIDLSGKIFHTITLQVKEPVSEVSRTYRVNINRVTKDDFVGSGTLEDPYLIYNLHALQEIAYDDFLLDKHFQLACNLDATDTVNWQNGAGFLPIGNSTHKFAGSLDGAGHTITGLFIARPDMDNVGLFGYTDSGEIKNLGLVDCNISGGNNVGALVGYNNSSFLEKCFSIGTVDGVSAVGGLVGQGAGPSSGTRYYLEYCYSRASVSGKGSASGGLIGELSSGELNNCYSAGPVQGISNSGGLVGNASFDCRSTHCYWDTVASGQENSALNMDIGKTTDAMQEQTTYTSWDFIGTWTIDSQINGGYPYLCVFEEPLLSPVVDNSLVLWLEGQHGSNDSAARITWQDLSGKGNHGTLNNFNFTRDSGWTGESLNFDGTDDGVLCPSINIGEGDFTMEIFASSDACNKGRPLFSKCTSTFIWYNKGFGITPAGYVSVLHFAIGTGLQGPNERIYTNSNFGNPII